MKKIDHHLISTLLIFSILSCNINPVKESGEIANITNDTTSKKEIGNMLDQFNLAAANSDFEKYFNSFSEDGRFIGTDATENWDKNTFMKFSKPFFDKKKTWNFKSIQRNIYIDKTGEIAWFDELLNTWMKICRGSGVVVKENNEWKLKQYVLSTTIPNNNIDSVIKIKSIIEDSLINKLTGK